jgi:hypothetical protein
MWDKQAIEAGAQQLATELGVSPNPKGAAGFLKHLHRETRTLRRQLLERLANLPPTSRPLQRTMESFGFEPETTAVMEAAKGTLQGVWSRDVPNDTKQFIVNLFLSAATKRADRAGIIAPLMLGQLEFAAKNFPGQIVLAVLENWHRMAKCGNPECPAPFFFAKRSTQQYCERGECTRYAQRKKSRKWWGENRAKGGSQ